MYIYIYINIVIYIYFFILLSNPGRPAVEVLVGAYTEFPTHQAFSLFFPFLSLASFDRIDKPGRGKIDAQHKQHRRRISGYGRGTWH